MTPPEDHSDRPNWLYYVRKAFLIAFLVWLVMVGYLALSQDSLIYHPSTADPVAAAQHAERFGLEPWQNEAGDLIGYRSLAAANDPRPRASVILFHGNSGQALGRIDYIQVFRDAAPNYALSVYLFEYPGYGARPGKPSQKIFLLQGAEAVRSVPEGEPLVLFGESLGTGVASGVANRNPGRVSGLILQTPFDDLASPAQRLYPLIPVRWIMRDQYPSIKWLQSYTKPVAFLIAGEDTIVPAVFGLKLHDSYSGPKLLLIAPRAEHNDMLQALSPEEWAQAFSFVLPARG
jgi:uncharacterized protein